jgi:oxygen-independent coproporphyrinogen-3 oxidase
LAGIYFHIPFCKQACHYCNFHFATSLRGKNELVHALLDELALQKDYLNNEIVETIYFGGGTPSLLDRDELDALLKNARSHFSIAGDAEITLEANPDDIDAAKLNAWKQAGVNRLSIGVQSFFNEDLLWMNRAHTADQASRCIELAQDNGFSNITIDLIYGTPFLSNEKWKENVRKAIGYNVPHLSCYALTVEPKTPLQKMILQKKTPGVDPDKQSEQFLLLMQWLEEAGYEHYEISNFAKTGHRSRHNSSYWQGKKYLGIGPSAHSFNGDSRQWNVSNNQNYVDAIKKGTVPFEIEMLTATQRLNEYIMTSLRTAEGLNTSLIGDDDQAILFSASKKYLANGLLIMKENKLQLTKEGKLLADGIASDLFFL